MRTVVKKKRNQIKGIQRSAIHKNAAWRLALQGPLIKFTDQKKEKFCEEYARTGRKKESAQKVGVSLKTVLEHEKIDPEFVHLVDEAKAAYKDKVHKVVEKVALEGVDEPIMGGRYKDKVVATKKVFATNILAMEMRKTDAAYRNDNKVDVTVNTGVIVVPANTSQEDWLKQHGKQPATIDHDTQQPEK